jgi:hypothetical protein
MSGPNRRHHQYHTASQPTDRVLDALGERSTTMHHSLPSRNPLVFLWLPFILAVVMLVGRELSVSAQSIAATRDADSPLVEVLQEVKADGADAEVSRSVGLMEGVPGEESALNASGGRFEVSRSVGLMTGAPGDASSLQASVRDEVIQSIVLSELPA